MNRKLYRVTYINDCSAWKKISYQYLLEEICTSFYNDTIEGKGIVELCNYVIFISDNEERATKLLIRLLRNFVEKNHLQWIVICDQHNAFYALPVVAKIFPFYLVETLVNSRGSNIKVIVSASANNEGYPTEMKNWQTHDLLSHRFNDEEFATWCAQYPLYIENPVNPANEDAKDALYWSGNYYNNF